MQISRENCLLLLVLAAIIPTGLGLKCFQCNSAEHPECAGVVRNDTASPFLQECLGLYDQKTPFCRKTVTTVVEGDHARVLRSCGWILDEKAERKDFCKKSDTDFIFKLGCACFSEMCNKGSYNHAKLWILPVLYLLLMCLINN